MRARSVLVCAVYALALAAPSAAARPVLFVGNVDDGTVTVLDTQALKTIGTLDVTPDGKTPQDPMQAAVYPALVQAKGTNFVQGLAASPDGRTLYVSRGWLGDVAAFDIATHAMLWRLQTDSVRADHITLSPDGGRLFVSALSTNHVQVIDTRTHAFVGDFPTGDWPHVLEFTPDGKQVVNGSLGNQLLPKGAPTRFELTFADPQTLQVKHTLSFDAGVRPFVFAPDGRSVYVQFSFYNGFREIDVASGKVLRSVDLPVSGPGASMQPSDYPNQAAHHGIDISGDHSTICDAATISNYVALVARSSGRTEAIIPVGDQPAEAHTSPDGRYCFVSDRGPSSNALSVISYAQRREVARIPMGHRPQEQAEADVPDAVLRAAGFTLPPAGSAAPQRAKRRHHRHRRHARRHHRRHRHHAPHRSRRA